MQYFIDFKAFGSTNSRPLLLRGQAVGCRFFELFTMPCTFILSASTFMDLDIQSLRVGNINYGYFIKDMGIALEEAKRMDLSLPGLALANQLYIAVKAQGHGKLGTQSLLLALEQMNGLTDGISVCKD